MNRIPQPKKVSYPVHVVVVLMTIALARERVLAQSASQGSTPATSGAASTEPLQMAQVSVNDVPIEQQILPTSRPFSSVYGFDDDIFSVPRNVTIISRAQMDAIDMQDTSQFSELTSSSYTDSNFGAPSNPSIRGQTADYFVNGMRQHVGDNGDGMPDDFNSVESINIVPGPATAVQGASAYVGGYVDVITKQPFFDGNHGFVSYTTGSYNTNRWVVDDGGPISQTLAFRFSYSGEDTDGFWYDSKKQTTAVYGAISWRPTSNYDLFLSVNGFWADYRQNFGINRVTQALISDGLYQSGTNINNGTTAGPGNLQNATNVESGGNTIAWGPLVPVDYRELAQGPASHAIGKRYNAQAIQTLKVSPDFKIVNNTMFSYTEGDTFNSDGFSEIDDPTAFIDNRTELLFTNTNAEINAGLEERYLHAVDYTAFFFEPVNVWDLSAVPLRSDINYTLAPGSQGYGGVPVPGWAGRYATPGMINDDTNNSEATTISPYIQGTWKVTSQLSLVAGARMDFMKLTVKDPLTPNTSATLGLGEPNANLSLLYRLASNVSTYATANFSENYTGDNADGGGFGIYTDPNTGLPTLPRSLFSEESVLYEYGWKFSTDEGKLFVTSDVFYQTRQNKPQGSPVIQYEYFGYELSANYQPNKNFYATVGYSWINGSLPADSDPYQSYNTNQIPGGPPDPNTNPAAYPTTGRLRAPGQPLDLFNALGQYTFNNGIGVESNVVVTSPMNNDFYGYLVIPWQYQIDASLSYKIKKFEIRLTVRNLTDRHNWQPVNALQGLEGIVSEPGFQTYVTVKYKF